MTKQALSPQKNNGTATAELFSKLFDGKKSKWIPLYRRLLARFSAIPGIEFFPLKSGIGIGHPHDARATMGVIRITQKGLEFGLGLARAQANSERLRPSKRSPRWITHRVVISSASDIDDEFLSWLKAARLQARLARPRAG
ncbi:MAG: DUF5655 domain-containing protein [Oligoflexia bacterium]|nr:DUF5655 domain-containing protein [Oligoflexia bacterium]